MKALGLSIAFVVFACSATETIGQQNGAVVSGDDCAVHADATSCRADASCLWADLGRPCQLGVPCQSGVCFAPGSSMGSGSGSGHAGCVCPNSGVCFEQIGGPPSMSPSPEIQCTTPAAGNGDPCSRITGQGTCTDSLEVTGLCLCDNGAR